MGIVLEKRLHSIREKVMKKLRYNKLVFKLTTPIVIIAAVVFAVIIPYMLRVNTSIVEKNIDEQVAHLSLSVRNYINEDVSDLRKKLRVVFRMPLIERPLVRITMMI